jgi:hypothetical protein
MAYSKNIHSGRARVKSSRRATSKSASRKNFVFGKRAVMTIIVVAMMTVILAVLFSIFATPERTITKKIEDIAADYYENYLYTSIASSSTINNTKPVTEIIGNYAKRGFDTITLHQLLLFDGQRHADAASILSRYCDEYETTIHYYPTEPFGQKDYHADIKYSCIFK